MSGIAVFAIVVVLFALAAMLLVAVQRRRETDIATGRLSRETRSRDKSAMATAAEEAERPSGRDVERAALVPRDATKDLVPVESAAPAPWVPPDPEVLGQTRRQFLNRSIVNAMGLSVTAFGLSCIAFLWPQSTGGFGSKIRIGKLSDVITRIREGQGFYYYAEGRMWITEYPSSGLDKARRVYPPPVLVGMERGIVALYQKCVHLGCRVPECLTSQWFECPCHGSQYNQVGEKKGGPAPRGMDRFAVEFSGDILTVDTGNIILGPPIGTNTTGQEAEGPNCLSGAGGHGA